MAVAHPLNEFLTEEEVYAHAPGHSNETWWIMHCEKRVPEMAPHFYKMLGIYRAVFFPKACHAMIRELCRGLTWYRIPINDGGSWEHHILCVDSRHDGDPLLRRVDELLSVRSMKNIGLLRLLLGFCVPFNAHLSEFPDWMKGKFIEHRCEKLLKELTSSFKESGAANIKTSPVHNPILTNFVLPPGEKVKLRRIKGDLIDQCFEKFGFQVGQTYDATDFVNNQEVGRWLMVKDLESGGVFERATGTLNVPQLFGECLLKTAERVKDVLDPIMKKLEPRVGGRVSTAPVKDILRLWAKGEELNQESKQFRMKFQKGSKKLGVDLAQTANSLIVNRIMPGGLLDAWNRARKDFEINVYDEIVQANHVKGNGQAILNEIGAANELEMTILRPSQADINKDFHGTAGLSFMNLDDLVRYTITLESFSQAEHAIEQLETALVSSGLARKVRVLNTMGEDFKALFVYFAVSLGGVAGRRTGCAGVKCKCGKPVSRQHNPYTKGWGCDCANHSGNRAMTQNKPVYGCDTMLGCDWGMCHACYLSETGGGEMIVEVQVTTMEYNILAKYCHILYEVSREPKPGMAFNIEKVVPILTGQPCF
jgi:hypothetical protein